MNLRERAEKYVKEVGGLCDKQERHPDSEDMEGAYLTGFREAIALAAEIARCHAIDYDDACDEECRHDCNDEPCRAIERELRALAEPEAPRCEHGVHGNDCFECYPTTPPGACL